MRTVAVVGVVSAILLAIVVAVVATTIPTNTTAESSAANVRKQHIIIQMNPDNCIHSQV